MISKHSTLSFYHPSLQIIFLLTNHNTDGDMVERIAGGERLEQHAVTESSQNPHNPKYGDMKLFLRLRIDPVALEVWCSEEDLKKEIEKREANKVLLKEKKYQKKMKELRKVLTQKPCSSLPQLWLGIL